MDRKLWLLRAISDWTLILVAWYFLLTWLGWVAALPLAGYFALIMATEWDILRQEFENQKSKSVEQNFIYPLEDGSIFFGTSSQYAEFLKQQKEELDGSTERTEDTV